MSQVRSPEAAEIREWSEVPEADWQALFAGAADPWGFEAVRCFALRSGLECVVVSKRLDSGEGPR